MRKLLLLLLFPIFCFGQTKINTSQADTSGFQSSGNLLPRIKAQTTGIFDSPTTAVLTGITSNVAVAYGTIQIYPSATKAFQLRRASDNVTQDFYFDNKGKVPMDVLNAFIGTSRGFVAKWYDQSGNAIDAVQATAALQPYVVIENGIVKVRFEELYSGTTGHALTYTLGSAINVNNTTIYCAYSNALANGNDQISPAFTSRYFTSTANHKLDLFIDGADATKPNALKMNTTSTSTLYGWGQANFFAINSSGSATKVWSNYSNVSQSAQSSFTETQWEIGNKIGSNTNPFAGDIYCYIQYSASQTDATIDTLSARLKVPYQLIAPADASVSAVIVGDSESEGRASTNNQNYVTQTFYRLKIPYINFGVTGNTFAVQNGTNFNTAIDGCIVGGKTNVLFLWMGTNDVVNSGRTQTLAYNDNVSYAQARHSAGFSKVVALTALDRNSVNTFSTLNPALIANTTDFDATLNIASDPRLTYFAGQGGSTTTFARPDYNYFAADNIHLINNGYGVVASYINGYLNSLTNTNTLVKSLQRKVETLETQVSYLQTATLFNRNPGYPMYWQMPGTVYVDTLSGSAKPLGNLIINPNRATNVNNAGNIFVNTTGTGSVIFGQNSVNAAQAAYTFTYATAPSLNILRMDLLNTNNTVTDLIFSGAQNAAKISYCYLETNGAQTQLTLYALQKLLLTSNQNDIQAISNSNTIWTGRNTGRMGIGAQVTPTAALHLPSGTASASTAPLKFTSGTNLSTTEAGAIEYDGSHLYFTATNAGTRFQLDQQQMPPAVVSSAGTLAITEANDYIFTGTTTTWTMQAISATHTGRAYQVTIKNRGSGNITLNSSAGGNDFYTTSAVNTITITPGSAITLMPDGTVFNQE